jgi:hypothetical protein
VALVRAGVDTRGPAVIERFAADPNEGIRRQYEVLRSGKDVPNPILKNLIASVKARGFQERYRSNVFLVPGNQ